jgi:hypothetical protein
MIMTDVSHAYPAWRYHPTRGAKIVQDETEDEPPEDGWVDTPSKLPPHVVVEVARNGVVSVRCLEPAPAPTPRKAAPKAPPKAPPKPPPKPAPTTAL